MPIHQSWFSDLAFGPDADGIGTVEYRAHREALAEALRVIDEPGGTCLVFGPEGAGKTTVVHELADALAAEPAVAVIGGVRLNGRSLLAEVLAQFGYAIEPDSTDDMAAIVARIAEEIRRDRKSPVLLVDNADRLYPSGMRALNQLAELATGSRRMLRLVLTGRDGLRKLVSSTQLGAIGERLGTEHDLEPMDSSEAVTYLHARLEACGVRPPDSVLPVEVCKRLHVRADGWPGRLNAEAMDAIERATTFPVTLADIGAAGSTGSLPPGFEDTVAGQDRLPADFAPVSTDTDATGSDAGDDDVSVAIPTIVVSRDGERLASHELAERKVLIGRSEFADIVISDGFVSKLHAMILVYRDALVLLDLNSANGLTVNSTVVSSTILRSGDVIVLGNHRLKVENAPVVSEEIAKLLQSGDTLRMKSLIDSRRRRLLKARLKLVDS